jgi:tetratricopeptide (TPR) repeat protein
VSKKPKIRLPKIPDRKIARIYEYIDAKEWAKARECIERYYKDFSFDATAYYAYEEILFESGAATPELIRIVREAAAGHPDEAGLLFNSGLAYLRGGYPALAHRALSSYCSRRLKEPESQEAERMVEELEEMLPGVLKNSGFRWPEDKETFYRLEEGRALMENFPDEDAVSIFEEALKIKPDSPMVLNNLARCLWERGEIDRAYETAKSAAEAFPSNL